MPMIEAYAINGRVYPVKSLGKKQVKQLEKDSRKKEKSKERALDAATAVLNGRSSVFKWAKRIALITALVPGVGVGGVAGCSAAYKRLTSKVPVAISDLSGAEPQEELQSIELVDMFDREWLDNPIDKEALKKEIFDFFLKNVAAHVPPNAIPFNRGGEVYKSAFNYRGVDFMVEFYFLTNDDDGKFSGDSINIRITEGGFQESLTKFNRDEGIQL